MQEDFGPVGQIVNSPPHIKALKHLKDTTVWKRPEKWRNSWILHNDDALCQTLFALQRFLVNIQIPIVSNHCVYQVSCSLNFGSSWDSSLGVKVHCFMSVEEFQQNMMAETQACEKRTSSGTSTNSRTDGACMCVCSRAVVWRWLG